MSDETYNGWKNYPTWAVNLWLSNDEGLYQQSLETAKLGLIRADDDPNVTNGIWTQEQADRFNVADAFKQWVAMTEEDEGGLVPDLEGLSADLLGYALDQVDWHEIADAWIESVREQVA